MNKRISLLIAVLLVIAMLSCSLFACSKDKDTSSNNANVVEEEDDGFALGTLGSKNNKYIEVTPTTAFEIVSKTAKSDISKNIVVTRIDDNQVLQVKTSMVDDYGLRFKVLAPTNLYEVGKWYKIEIKGDSDLSFATYPQSRKLTFRASTGNVNAEMSDSVVYVEKDFVKNVKPVDENKGYGTFILNVESTKIKLARDTIVMVKDDEINETSAYRVISFEDNNDGFATVTYNVPKYNDIYKSLMVKQTSVLNSSVKDDVTISDFEELKGTLTQLAEAAEIKAGAAKFSIDANIDGDVVKLDIKMTIPDIVKEKDGNNNLDLILSFTIESKITADTNISIGELVAAKDKGLSVKASFDNKLTFNAEVKDDYYVADQSALDDILNKVSNMIKGANENDVEINVFNWIIPIGNGIATVNFDVNVVMDFAFSGTLGIASTSNCKFDTTVSYDPDVEDAKKFSIEVSKPEFEFESVSASFEASVKTKVGLDAAITFNLLAGVLKFGVGAEVGSYNDIYGGLVTSNLLEDLDLGYGYYFEGGIYYDIRIIYGVLNLLQGQPSVKSDRIKLYDKGHQEIVNKIYTDTVMVVGSDLQDLEIYVDQTNLVTGNKSTKVLVDASKVKLDEEPTYVVIEDGKIKMTEVGLAQTAVFTVKVDIDGIKANVKVRPVDGTTTSVGTKTTVVLKPEVSLDNITAAYLGSDEMIDIEVSGRNVYFDKEDITQEGTIVIRSGDVIVAYVYVK